MDCIVLYQCHRIPDLKEKGNWKKNSMAKCLTIGRIWLRNQMRYMKQMQENNRRYYELQLDKELDDMEKDLKSGNTIGAMYHRNAADTYLRLLNLL